MAVSPFKRLLWASTTPVERVTDRAVLVSLASFMDSDTLRGFPGHERIAERAGCSVSTAQRALLRLRDRGLIRWTARKATQSLLYELVIPETAFGHSDRMDGLHSVKLTDVSGQNDRRSESLSMGGESPLADFDENERAALRLASGAWEPPPRLVAVQHEPEDDSLAVNGETAHREAGGRWAVGPFRP